MDTTPSVITMIIHRFFNVLPRYFHLIWFALGASCLGHTELSITMGWAGQFCVSRNIFLSQFIRITSFKCIVKFISDVIENQFVSSRHNGPGWDKGTTHWILNFSPSTWSRWISITTFYKTCVYWQRWWILAIFSLFTMWQCAVWNTWGPFADTAKKVIDRFNKYTYISIYKSGWLWVCSAKFQWNILHPFLLAKNELIK